MNETEGNASLFKKYEKNLKMTREELIKLEIMRYGPVLMCFNVFEGFLHYFEGIFLKIFKLILGIYDFNQNLKEIFVYDHCVKIIGWGRLMNWKTKKFNKYFMAINSWSNKWAKNGIRIYNLKIYWP